MKKIDNETILIIYADCCALSSINLDDLEST